MDAELANLITNVQKAAAGEIMVRKSDAYLAMRKIAARLAKENESVQKSFVRLFCERDSPGLPIFKALQARGDGRASTTIAKNISDTSTYPNDDDDADDAADFSALVDADQAANPKRTRTQSIDRVLASRAGRKALAVEKRNRLRKCLAY